VHRLIAPRDQKHQSNFVEFRNMSKIVYRRYAGLFFCACVDTNDNELAYLEAIHFFVEVLDAFFGNVCELDLVFNFYKVCLKSGGRRNWGRGERRVEKEMYMERILEALFGNGREKKIVRLTIHRSTPSSTKCSLRARLRRRVNRWCSHDWRILINWNRRQNLGKQVYCITR
jgi:hypothetical protein